MNELSKLLFSPIWWISVVVVGILINLISTFIQRRLDRQMTGVTSWWHKRSAARLAERESKIKELVEDVSEQHLTALVALRKMLIGFFGMLICILGLIFTFVAEPYISWLGTESYLTFIIQFLCSCLAVVGATQLGVSITYWSNIDEARNRVSKHSSQPGVTEASPVTPEAHG